MNSFYSSYQNVMWMWCLILLLRDPSQSCFCAFSILISLHVLFKILFFCLFDSQRLQSMKVHALNYKCSSCFNCVSQHILILGHQSQIQTLFNFIACLISDICQSGSYTCSGCCHYHVPLCMMQLTLMEATHVLYCHYHVPLCMMQLTLMYS